MTFKASFAALAAALTFTVPAGAATAQDAAQCNAMARSFEVRQTEVLELQALQAELAAEEDKLGEAWELKEEVRNFSPGHAAEADAARDAYVTARNAAIRATRDLHSKAQMLNADITQFNARCAGG